MASRSTVPVAVMVLMSILLSSLLQVNTGIKVIDSEISEGVHDTDVPNVRLVKDMDQRLMEDMVVGYPDADANGTASGLLHIFWGEDSDLMDIEEGLAGIRIVGKPGWRLGESFASWDYNGNDWNDLVVGCPGAGVVLIFDSLHMAIQPHGKLFTDGDADMVLSYAEFPGFGARMGSAEFTGDDTDDLLVISSGNQSVPPHVSVFMGGVNPDKALSFELPSNFVSSKSDVDHLDIAAKGRDALVVSSPDVGRVRWLYLDITEEAVSFAGADPDGVVRFTSSISQTGNTFGWGGADDGWDTSPLHVYDSLAGGTSVRYNQATGNVNNYDRSVSRVKQLQIEVGGINANGDDMSGAYGISFQVGTGTLQGANSAVLTFDYKYEDWGFENDERIWIKGRFHDSDGTVTWLGRSMDALPEPDATEEIFTLRGQNQAGQGINIFGGGQYSEDLIDLFDGPGNYYLDFGGKVSRWTNTAERAAFGFDNVSLVVRRVNISLGSITGSGGLGTDLHVQDVDGDDKADLLVGSPQEGAVHIFKGHLPYWSTVGGVNAFQSNTTIKGVPNNGFGKAMASMPRTPFSFFPSVLVADPDISVDIGRKGRLYHYICPLPTGDVTTASARDIFDAPAEASVFGFDLLMVGDRDQDEYPEWRVFGWSSIGNLTIYQVDPSPYPPDLRLIYPRVMMEIKGVVEIKVRVSDRDHDADPNDLRVYRSLDNRTWIYMGDIDRLDGDVAVKMWNTSRYENGRHFLKVSLEDGFGLESIIYSNWVDIVNHRPPQTILAYPLDGDYLANTISVTGRTTVSSWDRLVSPIDFYYSRDGQEWTFLANRSVPDDELLSREFVVELNTTTFEDGPIWFRFNATTEYGLGSEARNVQPAFIDNNYAPRVRFLSPMPGDTLAGTVVVSASIEDRDGDLILPPVLEYRAPGGDWEEIGDMEGDGVHNHTWDTTSVENGDYYLAVSISDLSLNEVREVLSDRITVHNPYAPSVSLDEPIQGQTISEEITLRASISDRDQNLDIDALAFFYRREGEDGWVRIGPGTLRGSLMEVRWNTREVPNGRYEFRASVADLDGLRVDDMVTGVTIDNFYIPVVTPGEMPSFGSVLKESVVLRFNVSDDEPIDPEDIDVSVYAVRFWERVGEVSLASDSPAFRPWGNVTYEVVWDTLEEDLAGDRRFPDYPGYLLRINVTDADGKVGSWESPVSYEVRNREGSQGGILSAGNTWLVALIFFVVLLLLLLLIAVFFIVFAEGRPGRKEEPPRTDRIQVAQPPPQRPLETPPRPAPKQEAPAEPVAPVPFIEPAPPSMEEMDSYFKDMGVGEKEPPKRFEEPPRPKREQPRSRIKYSRMDVSSVLPTGVLPTAMRAEETWEDTLDEFEDWEE